MPLFSATRRLLPATRRPARKTGRAARRRSGADRFWRAYLIVVNAIYEEAGLRCRSTTSSLPVPGPLLVPEGWPLS
jgi:hypothetical protein